MLPQGMKTNLRQGRFVKRINRFVCLVDFGVGRPVLVHVPSSGRMEELLVPGARVIVEPFPEDGKHKTRGRLTRVSHRGKHWVSIDSHLPNRLMEKAIGQGVLPEFADLEDLRREVAFGGSRLDFSFRRHGKLGFMEVKSVTLVEGGIALFPDAPTLRGTRHVKELADAAQEDYQAYLIFVIQRADARLFSPNWTRDPDFAQAVSEAMDIGTTVLAYDCSVTPADVALRGPVPVVLKET